MNYIKHLTGFFEKIINDHSLNPTHISLYISLFQCWNINRFQNPISITRDEVMRISKICSKATYHKCIKELHEKGYLNYEPSYNPFRGSLVHLFNFEENLKPIQKKARKSSKIELLNELDNEQVLDKHHTGIGIGAEQALVSSINNINITNKTNSLNIGQKPNLKTENTILLKVETENKQKLRQKKEFTIPPEKNELVHFFKENYCSETEAEKFYNHFQSNGWLIGGKSKMKDWKAAARNWMLNCQRFQSKTNIPQPKHLHTTIIKNYGEPL